MLGFRPGEGEQLFGQIDAQDLAVWADRLRSRQSRRPRSATDVEYPHSRPQDEAIDGAPAVAIPVGIRGVVVVVRGRVVGGCRACFRVRWCGHGAFSRLPPRRCREKLGRFGRGHKRPAVGYRRARATSAVVAAVSTDNRREMTKSPSGARTQRTRRRASTRRTRGSRLAPSTTDHARPALCDLQRPRSGRRGDRSRASPASPARCSGCCGRRWPGRRRASAPSGARSARRRTPRGCGPRRRRGRGS